ncbi:hypothetical protein [Rariglobus hedericola]|uniref:Carbohydrate-binding domain-containing protein n=1 Tax=Rariglobus hedericola TaxID=2597822 RepID=A0A556QKN4_9BACT|nr:hypothetical protein [Rariglobus hedericola]TSJ77204.1 hypothetical protein FPL22_13980 [Rariglobus hedericola]
MSLVRTGEAECLMIPAVQGFALGDWEATARVMKAGGAGLDFAQSWFPQLEADFKPGRVWLGIQGDDLVAYAVLEDDQPSNRATQLNDATWIMGDALELFFHAEGRPAYYEFHVTPDNVRLQLFFPSREAFLERRKHTHWAVADSRFESAARVNDTRTQWEAVMRIKLALVLDEPRDDGSRRFRFSFSRYDYQPGRKRPVTSATTRLHAPDFHYIPEWDWAEAARG